MVASEGYLSVFKMTQVFLGKLVNCYEDEKNKCFSRQKRTVAQCLFSQTVHACVHT